jgi:hypothetical protein
MGKTCAAVVIVSYQWLMIAYKPLYQELSYYYCRQNNAWPSLDQMYGTIGDYYDCSVSISATCHVLVVESIMHELCSNLSFLIVFILLQGN